MKRVIFATLILSTSTLATAAEYVKHNGYLEIKNHKESAEFSINSSTPDGSGVCNVEGTASAISASTGQKKRWLWNDSLNQCVAVISELLAGGATVMTKGCEDYCGSSAAGTMDGIYKPK
ncbi:hypothetical protein [Pantoea ananatis]|uniref:hypothetical protein n=1 Tax=Enterobacterales TaxID=91347 RepID=UPI0004660225